MYGLCCCRAVSAAVRPLCAVGLSGSCQAVTLGSDSDGAPRLSGSAVRLSDTCCQAVRESAVNAVRLSGTVRRCPGFAVRLSDQGSGLWTFARGGERSKSGVGASTRRSGSPATPAPLIAAAVAAAPTLAALPCRVVTRGEGTRIEDPSHQDRAGRGHMSLNPISSQSLTVLFS